MGQPNRWLHLRHPDGFDAQRFAQFEAHCAVFRAHAESVVANWERLAIFQHELGPYAFFDATLSSDRTVATLPIGGDQTVGSRAVIEDALSWVLWCYFPLEFQAFIDEGITETIDSKRGPQTHWRVPARLREIRAAFEQHR